MKKFIEILLYNWHLKIIAFLLAVIVWVYVIGVLTQPQVRMPRKDEGAVIAKMLPVVASLKGHPREGFAVMQDDITIVPDKFMVLGDKDLLESVRYIPTSEINIDGMERPLKRRVTLVAPSGVGVVEGVVVEVDVPIEKQ